MKERAADKHVVIVHTTAGAEEEEHQQTTMTNTPLTFLPQHTHTHTQGSCHYYSQAVQICATFNNIFLLICIGVQIPFGH